eukprot:4861346-Prymnesium_polylepis.2
MTVHQLKLAQPTAVTPDAHGRLRSMRDLRSPGDPPDRSAESLSFSTRLPASSHPRHPAGGAERSTYLRSLCAVFRPSSRHSVA